MLNKVIWFDNPNEFIKRLVSIWVDYNASDIHITPSKDYVYIRFRISGNLVSFYWITLEQYEKLLNTIKVRAYMTIDEHNHIQDWKMSFNFKKWEEDLLVNVRVSVLPTIYWENTVMRLLLSGSKYLDINNLGFSNNTLDRVKNILNMNDWLVLLCGGTWSWKTTTLYSLLHEFDPITNAVFTLEDPVEYVIDWYVQSEIKERKIWDDKVNYTFQEWLVWILRQDPDIIMIWEIRRGVEASICLEAASTWHIVMWSTHASSAIGAITRLKKLWVEPYLLASSIKYIIFQKLLRWLCPHCRKEIILNKNEIPEKFQSYLPLDKNKFYSVNSEWCENCTKWYVWNTLVAEIIQNDDDIYNQILSEGGDIEFNAILKWKWFIPYYIDALNKAFEWLIDIKDVIILD